MKTALVIVLASAMAAYGLPVYAGIQDYQIIRLITMKSDCSRKSLERTDNENGTVSFFAACSNVSHYPDGVKVLCDDQDNEQSCKILTKSKKFEHLKLLQN